MFINFGTNFLTYPWPFVPDDHIYVPFVSYHHGYVPFVPNDHGYVPFVIDKSHVLTWCLSFHQVGLVTGFLSRVLEFTPVFIITQYLVL